MKKIKKLLAMIMAMTMVLGMAMTVSAAVPSADDTATATVKNVEYNALVTAYQIVEATYNANGFTGYETVEGVELEDALAPTADEITAIAADSALLGSLDSEVMTTTAVSGLGDFTAELAPGYWLVLVKGGPDNDIKEVYNPMLLGIYYSESGSDDETSGGDVDANGSWTVEDAVVYAKSSEIELTKTAVDTEDEGDVVEFTIDTTVPYYSNEYDPEFITFGISDSLTNLALKVDNASYKVKVESGNGVEYSEMTPVSDYTLIAEDGAATLDIAFNAGWVTEHGGEKIKITYYATLQPTATELNPGTNEATVTYTNDSTYTTDTDTDVENVYTFDVGGSITGMLLEKVQPGEVEGTTKPLDGAEFTLYTDESCMVEYANINHADGTVVSASDGAINILGLDEGTYYLKETNAPGGFTVNGTVYRIVITPTITNEQLESWTIAITDMTTSETVDNVFTVMQGAVVKGDGNGAMQIMNTKLPELPSTGGIGTTIFTIGGCAIMIVAAVLYLVNRRKSEEN